MHARIASSTRIACMGISISPCDRASAISKECATQRLTRQSIGERKFVQFEVDRGPPRVFQELRRLRSERPPPAGAQSSWMQELERVIPGVRPEAIDDPESSHASRFEATRNVPLGCGGF